MVSHIPDFTSLLDRQSFQPPDNNNISKLPHYLTTTFDFTEFTLFRSSLLWWLTLLQKSVFCQASDHIGRSFLMAFCWPITYEDLLFLWRLQWSFDSSRQANHLAWRSSNWWENKIFHHRKISKPCSFYLFLKASDTGWMQKKCTEGSNKQSPVGGAVLTLKVLKTHDCFLCIYRKEGQTNGNA